MAVIIGLDGWITQRPTLAGENVGTQAVRELLGWPPKVYQWMGRLVFTPAESPAYNRLASALMGAPIFGNALFVAPAELSAEWVSQLDMPPDLQAQVRGDAVEVEEPDMTDADVQEELTEIITEWLTRERPRFWDNVEEAGEPFDGAADEEAGEEEDGLADDDEEDDVYEWTEETVAGMDVGVLILFSEEPIPKWVMERIRDTVFDRAYEALVTDEERAARAFIVFESRDLTMGLQDPGARRAALDTLSQYFLAREDYRKCSYLAALRQRCGL